MKAAAAAFARSSFLSLDQHLEEAGSSALPPKKRTLEELKDDLDKIKRIMKDEGKIDPTFSFLDNMTPEEWFEKRRRTMGETGEKHE